MKKIYYLVLLLFVSISAFTQSQNYMSYQAVLRNSSNNLITNQAVGIRISILQGSVVGTEVYTETQTTTSNINGLVTLEIGNGTPTIGTYNTINWSNGPYFIKTETDPTGGNSYTIVGVSQLMSVPFALYALNSGSSIPGPQGLAGLNGADGATGPMGPQGPAGVAGPAGNNGLDGATGPMGPQGPAGNNGLDGATGPMGPQGSAGVTGPAGNNGLDGATGPMGPQGPAGPAGPAGNNGLDGATGPMGPQGPAGVAGPTGATGPQGPAGNDGLDGATGPMGPQGPAGVAGATGATGPQGPAGNDGLDGATGPMGPQGPAGVAGAAGPAGATGATGPQGPAGNNGIAGYVIIGDVGSDVTTMVGGDINSAIKTNGSSSSTIIINFTDQGNTNFVPMISLISHGTADFDNDVETPVIRNVTSTSIEIFLNETSNTVQDLRINVILMPY